MGNILNTVNALLGKLGYEVRYNPKGAAHGIRESFTEVFEHAKKLGLNPSTVIDVGVANGTVDLYAPFPRAFHLLIEPLQEYKDAISKILEKYNGMHVMAAATNKKGTVEFNIHSDHLPGSSMLKEEMGPEADGVVRKVDAVVGDDIVSEYSLSPPFIIKVDVQGAELSVLDGFSKTLEKTDLVVLEVSFFKFMTGAPEFADIVIYMKNHGFVAYDLLGGLRRLLDGALGQIDMVFVKEKGFFRKDHSFATNEQWNEFASCVKRIRI